MGSHFEDVPQFTSNFQTLALSLTLQGDLALVPITWLYQVETQAVKGSSEACIQAMHSESCWAGVQTLHGPEAAARDCNNTAGTYRCRMMIQPHHEDRSFYQETCWAREMTRLKSVRRACLREGFMEGRVEPCD